MIQFRNICGVCGTQSSIVKWVWSVGNAILYCGICGYGICWGMTESHTRLHWGSHIILHLVFYYSSFWQSTDRKLKWRCYHRIPASCHFSKRIELSKWEMLSILPSLIWLVSMLQWLTMRKVIDFKSKNRIIFLKHTRQDFLYWLN